MRNTILRYLGYGFVAAVFLTACHEPPNKATAQPKATSHDPALEQVKERISALESKLRNTDVIINEQSRRIIALEEGKATAAEKPAATAYKAGWYRWNDGSKRYADGNGNWSVAYYDNSNVRRGLFGWRGGCANGSCR